MAAAHKSCVLVTDLEGVIRFATFSACRLFGLSDYEATNMHFDEVTDQIKANISWTRIADGLAARELIDMTTSFTSPVGYRGRMHLQAHPVFGMDDKASSFVVLLEILPKERKVTDSNQGYDFSGKYATTSLTYERGRELFLRMDRLVREEELFRKRKLSVSSLAQQLNTNTQYLSHVVNYFCGERFPSYVNRLRIQWMAANAGSGDRKRTGVWREAGFGSYSAYHRALKQLKRHAAQVADRPQAPGKTAGRLTRADIDPSRRDGRGDSALRTMAGTREAAES